MHAIGQFFRGLARMFRRPEDDFGDRLLADLGIER